MTGTRGVCNGVFADLGRAVGLGNRGIEGSDPVGMVATGLGVGTITGAGGRAVVGATTGAGGSVEAGATAGTGVCGAGGIEGACGIGVIGWIADADRIIGEGGIVLTEAVELLSVSSPCKSSFSGIGLGVIGDTTEGIRGGEGTSLGSSFSVGVFPPSSSFINSKYARSRFRLSSTFFLL